MIFTAQDFRSGKQNPSATIPLVHTDAQIVNSKKKRKSKAQRFAERQHTKNALADLYVQAGLKSEAGLIRSCCTHFTVLTCGRHEAKRIPNARCYLRACPDCAEWRGGRLYRKLSAGFAELMRRHPNDQLIFITLTLKHSNTSLKVQFRRVQSAFAKLRRRNIWKDSIRAAFSSFEPTVSKGLWHPHIHILALRSKWIEQAELSAVWEKITGDSFIVDIRPVRKLEEGLREVLKYTLKPADVSSFTPSLLRQFHELKSAKLAGTYGELRGLDLDSDLDEPLRLFEGNCCPECGGILFDVRMSRLQYQQFLIYSSLCSSFVDSC